MSKFSYKKVYLGYAGNYHVSSELHVDDSMLEAMKATDWNNLKHQKDNPWHKFFVMTGRLKIDD